MAKWKEIPLGKGNDMSNDWAKDISDMHAKFGVNDWFEKNKDDKVKMQNYLLFRLGMVREELDETCDAFKQGDPEEIVDGLIDLCVFAIGTLDVFGVDANKAWDAVYKANISKEPGVKPGRPNPFGLPDLLKPEDWQAPSHEDNHGDFSNAL
jgi:predicted HAD superfamily Cof-like phosphohydrolase|tara:strand:- start:302 stop:757 length:456 start_codon:yes stop_codon:yes gene_type:complete